MRNGQPQKSTLSIRVSESLRQHLEHARSLLANARDEGVSISEVAKLLLESTVNECLDHRFEAASLYIEPTASLNRIRQKWGLGYPLNHAEWLLLAEFVQSGCEDPCPNPDLPGPKSVAQVLMAFLAVRSLRMGRGVELDRHYLGNLRWQAVNDRQLDPELVTDVVQLLLLQLEEAGMHWKCQIFAARNLYLAIRDEKVQSVIGLNDVLKPHMPTLMRLAARGHWLRMRQPLGRTDGACRCSFAVPTLGSDCIRLDLVVNDGELQVFITFVRRKIVYPLQSYPLIRDFSTMLNCLKLGDKWNGSEFFGYTEHTGTAPDQLAFCHRASGIKIRCAGEEWDSLRTLFSEALSRSEIEPVLSELSMEYGEI